VTTKIPEAILKLIERTRDSLPPSTVAGTDGDTEVRSGEVWLASHPDGQRNLHVLVVRADSDEGLCEVLLAHNHAESATDMDILITREQSGLPYTLFAQLDVRGTMRNVDLERRVARLSLDMGEFSIREAYDDEKRDRRGLRLCGPLDPRWQWKREQGEDMSELSAPALVQVLDPTRANVCSPIAPNDCDPPY